MVPLPMKKMRSLMCAGLVLALITTMAGCSGAPDDAPLLVEATGMILMDGQPLADASVSFNPTSGNRGASGRTDAEGRFVLSYGGSDGCPLGEHTVSVSTREMILDEYGGVEGMKEETIPVRYNSQSKLKATVDADAAMNNFTFELESKGRVE